jgi:hypothetical protein
MRRALPLCAIFAAACLLLAGVLTAVAAEIPATPVMTSDSPAKLMTEVSPKAESKWTETIFPAKRSP